eukprot:jgi/Psemu1/180910/e_gw1.18.32.1
MASTTTTIATTATPTTTTANSSQTSRQSTYDHYLTLAEKALHKSRASLDTRSLIRLAYGDDTAHIGGSDMLEGILDGVLDTIANEAVLTELRRYGTTHSSNGDTDGDRQSRTTTATPRDRLATIDTAIAGVVAWEERRDRAEGTDAGSAREALARNLLPDGVSTDDVVAHREYRERLRAAAALEGELQRLRDEIAELEARRDEERKVMREQLETVDDAETELEAAANACAMVTA